MARSRITKAMQQLTEQQSKLTETAAFIAKAVVELEKEQDADPFPVRFAGVADNYRFTTGPKGEVPTHRFEVLCGNGIFIHVEAAPEQFAKMMVDMDMGDIKPSKVNGKVIVVERNPEDGTVPIKMYATEPLTSQDKWSNYLWKDAPVRVISTGEKAIVTGDMTEGGDGRPYVTVDVYDDSGAVDRTTNKYCDTLALDL